MAITNLTQAGHYIAIKATHPTERPIINFCNNSVIDGATISVRLVENFHIEQSFDIYSPMLYIDSAKLSDYIIDEKVTIASVPSYSLDKSDNFWYVWYVLTAGANTDLQIMYSTNNQNIFINNL